MLPFIFASLLPVLHRSALMPNDLHGILLGLDKPPTAARASDTFISSLPFLLWSNDYNKMTRPDNNDRQVLLRGVFVVDQGGPGAAA
jgi:hypothetical protein